MMTHSSDDPQQRRQRTVLHAAQFFQLFMRELLEDRIPPYDRFEGDVRDGPGAGRDGPAFRSDGVCSRDGDRPSEFAFQLRKRAAQKSGKKLVRHRKPTESPVHCPHLGIERLRMDGRDRTRARNGGAPGPVVARHAGT